MRLRRDEIKIGHWWAPCCIYDLERVETEDDLEDARSYEPFFGAWSTFEEAIADLLHFRAYSRESDRQDDIAYAVETWGPSVLTVVNP
jgi:hypothetical protein